MIRPSLGHARFAGVGLALLGMLLLAASSSRASTRESEATFEALLHAEESLAEVAELARLGNLRAQDAAAIALSRAATALAAALETPRRVTGAALPDAEAAETNASAQDRASVARRQRLVIASMAYAEAREALSLLLAESAPLEARAQESQTRVEALQEALTRLKASAPPRADLDGTWSMTLTPLGETLTLHLSQAGPYVGGPFESSTGASGTITGQVAGGHVRLERYESARGKLADIVGMIRRDGGFEGTWQSTLLGSGKPEAGTFVATQAPGADGN